MALLTRARLEAATNGFRALYLSAYDGTPQDWHKFAMEVPSNSAQETYDWITGIPGMRELIGEADIASFAQTGFSIRNKEWHNTIGVKRADIERDNLGLVSTRFKDMGKNAADHPRILIAQLLNNGFSATDYTGLAFFAANKPTNPDDKSKGFAKFTNAGTAALSAASFVTGRVALRKMTDAKGNNMGLGNKLRLVVPPALEETANKLRTSETVPSAAGTASETNSLRGTFEVEVINELSSDTAWFLMDDSREVKPLVVQMEVKPEFNAAIDHTDSRVLLNAEYLYQSYGRWNAGYGLSQLAYGSTGAA